MSLKEILRITIALCVLFALTIGGMGLVAADPPGSDTNNPNDGPKDNGKC